MFNNGSSWQQINRSPNSMGSNGSPTMNPMMPAVPSPLLNSINSGSIMSNQPIGMIGTPQQPPLVRTPSSVQQQFLNPSSIILRNPFEEDLEYRPASRQQMPPPTSSNQRLYFDLLKEFKSQIYFLNNDPMIRCRLPVCCRFIVGQI